MQYLILSTEKLMYAFYSQRESMLWCSGVIYGRSVVILVSRSELFDDISPALAAENVLAISPVGNEADDARHSNGDPE